MSHEPPAAASGCAVSDETASGGTTGAESPLRRSTGHTAPEVDLLALLDKVINYFGEMEGTTYLRHLDRDDDELWRSSYSDVAFTDAEVAILRTIDDSTGNWD